MTSKSTTNNAGLKTIIAVVIVGVICFIISKFVFQIVIINGPSMEPSYKDGQWVVINRLDKNIKSGQVVVFTKSGISDYIVKRVYGLPGDTVVITDGNLMVNGRKASQDAFNYSGLASEKITLGSDQYFVIGDNANNSKDSRYEEIGIVTKNQIQGIVIGGSK